MKEITDKTKEKPTKKRTKRRRIDAIRRYCDLNSDTYSNWTESMIAAGYSTCYAKDHGKDVLENKAVLSAIDNYRKEFARIYKVKAEQVFADFQVGKKICLDKGDMSNYLRACENQAKVFGMYKEDKPQGEADSGFKGLPEEDQELLKQITSEFMRRKLKLKRQSGRLPDEPQILNEQQPAKDLVG